ncbi:MAG: UPF0280 family protein [Candidatus Omnitrophota bacterium]
MTYEPRTYRRYTISEDLVSFRVTVFETDLFISSDRDLSDEAEAEINRLRRDIESYIKKNPDFKEALEPVALDKRAPLIVKDMIEFSSDAGVGPMAAVAGAIAEGVGKRLLEFSSQIIVENGGDIFISSKKPRIVGIYAGSSKLSKRIGLKVESDYTPCGVCTSSATVGHSLSFGKADAVTVLSKSASLADAAATSLCNRVQVKDDIEKTISYGKNIKGVDGIVIIFQDTLGVWGNIKLVDI